MHKDFRKVLERFDEGEVSQLNGAVSYISSSKKMNGPFKLDAVLN